MLFIRLTVLRDTLYFFIIITYVYILGIYLEVQRILSL